MTYISNRARSNIFRYRSNLLSRQAEVGAEVEIHSHFLNDEEKVLHSSSYCNGSDVANSKNRAPTDR